MDILEFQGHNYLVVVDFSHFPELRLIKGKTAKVVIGALRSIFAVHGVPVEVIADNMPFGSEAMRHFLRNGASRSRHLVPITINRMGWPRDMSRLSNNF